MDYQKIPWNIEDTIDHLKAVRNILAAKLNTTNHEGKGEEDVRELNYDFGRAINALKENQQYKKTGLNPNQVSETICELSATKRVLEHYQKLGTLEEFRDAVEKQKAKKPIKSDDKICDLIVHYRCPCCGKYFGGRGIHDVILFSKERYCNDCGQRIDWSEEE